MAQNNVRCPWCKSSNLTQISPVEEVTRVIPDHEKTPVIVTHTDHRAIFHCNNCHREQYGVVEP